MGVSIYVGFYASCLKYDPDIAVTLEQQFKAMNTVLVEQGVSTHTEPTAIVDMKNRAASNDFSYGKIFQLRQLYTDTMDGHSSESHLVCHSDFDGFYLPVEFHNVSNDKRIQGTFLGSSYELMKELVSLAPELGISLRDGILCDEEAAEVNARAWSSDRHSDELMAWIALFEAARLSIEHKSAIVFR